MHLILIVKIIKSCIAELCIKQANHLPRSNTQGWINVIFTISKTTYKKLSLSFIVINHQFLHYHPVP